ncbi:MAG: class I SAM-dependent methyltransferase [Acidimicrobiales bacterium]
MVDKGEGERPGSHHYRAYVGPAQDYDLLGGLQLSLLLAVGLREHHNLCDVGCGSLRAGRMLLSYLEPGRYHGLEPEAWVVQAAVDEELGEEFVKLRRPVFRHETDYGVSRFDTRFDYVLAQSIFSHTFADDAATLLGEVADGLADDGVLVATFYPYRSQSKHPLPRGGDESGWRYPGNVAYEWDEVVAMATTAGLQVARLDWPHPRQQWFMAARLDGTVDVRTRAAAVQPPAVTAGAGDEAPNTYYTRRFDQSELDRGAHRQFVGGSWQRLGGHQFRFLRDRGLRRSHRLLDIGCGSLRGGVRFVRYLDEGCYYGIDVNDDLLRAGLEIEIPAADLSGKLPAENLFCTDDFDATGFGVSFDVALAQSVFTHLPLNHIRRCLTRTAGVMGPGTSFYATFFRCPDDHPVDEPLTHVKTVTHPDRDPYHYRLADFEWAVDGLPWVIDDIGDWGHPFGQEMLRFERID